ncbi:MAG TPA: ergothioneine biosynthesis protein EgtB, partial [Pyrinomonadaceae bacterium]|nr:ergothioneine biosynthesis protein EgtB [Pyrinomonadaceae bacterium]
MVSTSEKIKALESSVLADLYQSVRARTMQIVSPLETEDYVIQTAEFMSPPRWHIGHTSWFFETLLQTYKPGYQPYSEDFLFYFNSYYEGFGPRILRAKRGTKSRPTVTETVAYRSRIDELMIEFLAGLDNDPQSERVQALVRLGLEHEMQHQELLVYDIKHLLADLYKPEIKPAPRSTARVEGMAEIEGGLFWLGYGNATYKSGDRSPNSKEFAFDNEKPAHQVYLQDFAIDRALVSNGEFLEFMRDGGYQNFRWWFSEGWETVNREQWQAPLYWELHTGAWMIRDFSGLHPVESKANEPVSHVSYYEASAFAKWVGKRLPTEGEWEKAACVDPAHNRKNAFPWGEKDADASKANLLENRHWAVTPIGSFPEGQTKHGVHQMIGEVWEWTTSD